jgi:hypothetical protein
MNKEKHKEYNKLYRLNNKEKIKKIKKEYYLKNKEIIKEKVRLYKLLNSDKIRKKNKIYILKNKEKRNKYNKEYSLKNPHIQNAINAKRYASKLKATPKFANLKKIKEIYKNCPKGYHVDHIVPLQGKDVCGLHVEWNLQYLTPSENSSKSNRFVW